VEEQPRARTAARPPQLEPGIEELHLDEGSEEPRREPAEPVEDFYPEDDLADETEWNEDEHNVIQTALALKGPFTLRHIMSALATAFPHIEYEAPGVNDLLNELVGGKADLLDRCFVRSARDEKRPIVYWQSKNSRIGIKDAVRAMYQKARASSGQRLTETEVRRRASGGKPERGEVLHRRRRNTTTDRRARTRRRAGSEGKAGVRPEAYPDMDIDAEFDEMGDIEEPLDMDLGEEQQSHLMDQLFEEADVDEYDVENAVGPEDHNIDARDPRWYGGETEGYNSVDDMDAAIQAPRGTRTGRKRRRRTKKRY
jgi:hypothetical protein